MSKKWKVLTISDHPLVPSGVGLQTRYIIEGLLRTKKYQFRSLGGAIQHNDYRPQKLQEYEDDWVILPVNGYGNEQLLRQILDSEDFDALWFMTDPRFYTWLFNMSDEIRDRGIPLLYYHVWDNYPVPQYNRGYYKSCDFIGCISKLTHNIVSDLDMKDNSAYIPHAVDSDTFRQYSPSKIKKLKGEYLPKHKDKFIVFYNSRNARRKMTSDVLKIFKQFVDKVGSDKAFLLMHTDPHDKEGANLLAVAKLLGLTDDQIAFSKERISSEKMADLYNIADVTMNISNNEGFGLSCLESLSCGTLVIVNKTGGLQDQPVDNKGNIFGVCVEPSTTTLTGSQQIPYIFDDRCSDEDLLNAVLKIYKMSQKEKRNLGEQARAWTKEAFSLEGMVTSWDEALSEYITKFQNGYPDRIKVVNI